MSTILKSLTTPAAPTCFHGIKESRMKAEHSWSVLFQVHAHLPQETYRSCHSIHIKRLPIVEYKSRTLFVEVVGLEPMLGSGMLLTRSRTFWIFWSEILTCSSGSSPETLNLTHNNQKLPMQHVQNVTLVYRRDVYLGILASFSTIDLASCTVKSIGWRMCWNDELSNRADFQPSPGIYIQLI